MKKRKEMRKIEILNGYIPGLIGRVAEMHAEYYSKEWNFGQYFEAKVAIELSNYLKSYDSTKDCIWSLVINGTIEGSITIDCSSEKPGVAHLRWFIVSDIIKGTGAGNDLVRFATDFCKKNLVNTVYLWTFKGLNPAKHLYQKFGFEKVEEVQGSQWGMSVTEQRYELGIK